MTAHTVALVLGVIAGVELVAAVVFAVFWLRTRRDLDELRRATIESPRNAMRFTPTRAVKAFVDTAVRVRDQGVGGFLASSLDDLARWGTENRAQITRVAAPDGTVTIFFSDIENSTSLNERLGDERWVRVLQAHDRVVRDRVARHDGHVVKSQGDGYMAVFADPTQAAQAAIDAQRALRSPTHRVLRRTPIKIRVGLHVGAVVAREGDYFGRNVAFAARVAGAAGGGQILVSEDVRAAIADDERFELSPCEEMELKGLSDRHQLWELASQ